MITRGKSDLAGGLGGGWEEGVSGVGFGEAIYIPRTVGLGLFRVQCSSKSEIGLELRLVRSR